MPRSFSAVRAPPQSPVSVSCSQIDFGFGGSLACAADAPTTAATANTDSRKSITLNAPRISNAPSP